ncbi:MAG: hypothetical protein ACOC40_02830 [Thermoplasmatota archaeon]
MSLKISDKNRPRLTLIVIFLIFVSITAYSLNNAESKQKIEVEEGYEEISVNYIKPESGITYQNTNGYWYKNVTARTILSEDNNYLKFKTTAISATSYSSEYELDLKLNVKCNFESKYQVDSLLLQMYQLNGKNISANHLDFNTAGLKENGVNLWSTDKNVHGATGKNKAFLGFDINKNNFTSEVNATLVIPKHNWNNSYAIKIQSVAKGLSQDLVATIDINIEKEVLK